MRSAIRKRVVRGHAQVQVSFKRSAEAGADNGVAINEALCCKPGIESFRDVAARFLISISKPDLNQALRLPGILIELKADIAGGR